MSDQPSADGRWLIGFSPSAPLTTEPPGLYFPRVSLTTRVLIALAVGLAGGIVISQTQSPTLLGAAAAIEPIGTLFINAIRMTVIPLVVGSLIVGVASAPDAR